MAVGFPGLANQRTTIRATPNPLDKATVVSIYPKGFREVKPTIQPGVFIVQAGSYEKPSTLVVGTSSWWRELDEEQPLLEIPVSAIQIADSVVRDYSNGLIGCNMSDAMPGLFFIPGELTVEKIKESYKKELDKAAIYQKNWYQELVKMGDILWARSNGNPLSISDDMRLAAQELQLKDKPWLKDFSTLQLTNCPACGFLRNNSFPVCANCKTVIDRVQFEKLGLKFAS